MPGRTPHPQSRPHRAPPPSSTTARALAAAIIRQYGCTSVAHLCLLNDKTYHFSPGGSVTAFGMRAGCAVALGEPIGPPADLPAAITDFANWAAQQGWWAAFCLTSALALPLFQNLGYHSACLGYEAVIDLASFNLEGGEHKTIRRRFNRLSRLGYHLEIVEPPVPTPILDELSAISRQWLGKGKGEEKGFFLTCFDAEYVSHERLALAINPQGRVEAFVNLIPAYQPQPGKRELSLDLMRRSTAAETGIMDFLFTAMFFWACNQGYNTFNLGLSPLYRVGQAAGSSAFERLLGFVYAHLKIYAFQGLTHFKTKFRPQWQPQYLIYPSPLSLPQTGLALARLNAGPNTSLLRFVFPQRGGPTLD